MVRFNRRFANFYSVASTGTRSLALFYYWYIKMEKASLIFMDEFDAFYHFELAANIIRLMTLHKGGSLCETLACAGPAAACLELSELGREGLWSLLEKKMTASGF